VRRAFAGTRVGRSTSGPRTSHRCLIARAMARRAKPAEHSGKSPSRKAVESHVSIERNADSGVEPCDGETRARDVDHASDPSRTNSTPHEITGRYRPVETCILTASTSSSEASSSSPTSATTATHRESKRKDDFDEWSFLPPPTHVHVAVVSCRGLRGSDWTGYSDPFVEVGAFGARKKRRYRTSVAKMTLNPNWDVGANRFLIRCDDDEPFRGVAFSVFDRDWGASSEFLGGAVVAARDIPRAGKWVELALDLQRALPEATVEVDARAEEKKKRKKHAVSFAAAGSLGTLTVRIAAADDLSWDILRDTATIVPRVALRAFTPGKFTAVKIKTRTAGYKLLHKKSSTAWKRNVTGAHPPTIHPKVVRHVHVCVLAGKHLAASDIGRLPDAFVKVQLDNGHRREFSRTATERKTFDPVFGNGEGETFTMTRRPGASEIVLRVLDSNDWSARNKHVSTGVVPLAQLPPNGAWSENLVVPLFPDGFSESAHHAGESKGFLVVRCAASSPVPFPRDSDTDQTAPAAPPAAVTPAAADPLRPSTGTPRPRSAAFAFWPNVPKPPPPPPGGAYVNKMDSSSFAYFQVCGARDLPVPREGGFTNFRATASLNSDRAVARTEVQEDVSADSVWAPEVFSFPLNPRSQFVTVRVYGAATKLWDPEAARAFARAATPRSVLSGYGRGAAAGAAGGRGDARAKTSKKKKNQNAERRSPFLFVFRRRRCRRRGSAEETVRERNADRRGQSPGGSARRGRRRGPDVGGVAARGGERQRRERVRRGDDFVEDRFRRLPRMGHETRRSSRGDLRRALRGKGEAPS